ncbi:MAG TPA: NfeD family protein [Natrialbaceae archaeon]|nr:NfeD family protein [Natrialbaceae archaeon]
MAEFLGLDLSLLLTVIGIVLIIMEAMAPGAHLIVLGVALLAAGLIGLSLGPTLGILATPLALAAMVLLFGSLALFIYREFDFYGGKGAGQTSDSDSLSGQIGRVTERVTRTSGEVKLDNGGFNPYYQARSIGGTIEEGTEVIVVDPGGGNVITVDAIEGADYDEIDRELERARERMEAETEEESGAEEDVETDESGTRTSADSTDDDPQTETESQ